MPRSQYITQPLTTLYVQEELARKIKRYDGDNAYPQRMFEVARNSGTASSSIKLMCKFIKGTGFTDDTILRKVVHPSGLRFRNVWKDIVEGYSKFGGFALHFNYNALLEISSIQSVRFEHCRLGLSDSNEHVNKIAVWDDWDMKRNKAVTQVEPQYVDIFNPNPDVVAAQIEACGGIQKYKGQILYFSNSGPGQYPTATFHEVLEDVINEGKIKRQKLNAVSRDFQASHVIEYPYEFEGDEEWENAKAQWRQFQGEEGTGKVIVLENPNPEREIKITPMEWKDTDGRYEYTEKSIKENIIQFYHQTPTLRGFMVSGSLGNSQEIENAFNLYNVHTEDDRIVLIEQLEDINKYMAFPLSDSGNFEIETLTFEVTETNGNANNNNSGL